MRGGERKQVTWQQQPRAVGRVGRGVGRGGKGGKRCTSLPSYIIRQLCAKRVSYDACAMVGGTWGCFRCANEVHVEPPGERYTCLDNQTSTYKSGVGITTVVVRYSAGMCQPEICHYSGNQHHSGSLVVPICAKRANMHSSG